MKALVLLRAVATGCGVVLGVTLLIFMLVRAIPGDPVRIALGPTATEQQVEALTRQLGFDRSLPEQYLTFLSKAVRFEFGLSLYSNRPVSEDLVQGLPATLELIFYTTLIVVAAGFGFGILSARHERRPIDQVMRVASIAFVSVPVFVWALLLIMAFAYWTQILPVGQRLGEFLTPPPAVTRFYTIDALIAGDFEAFRDALAHLVMPAIALSLPSMAQIIRLTRTSMIETYRQPYIEFNRSYGIPESVISLKYALRPALVPILTILGMQIVALLGGAFLIETVFAWPGMARYGVEAVLRKDVNAIVAVVTITSVFFVVVNILIDGIAVFVDPRTRTA